MIGIMGKGRLLRAINKKGREELTGSKCKFPDKKNVWKVTRKTNQVSSLCF